MNSMDKSLLNYSETVSCTDGIHVLGNRQDFCFTSVQTDSRLVTEGTLFIPLIGEFQDGHKYIPQAVEKGASAVFISRGNYEKDGNFFIEIHKKNPSVNFIAVDNTMHALQSAAACYVSHFPSLIKVGITGSSGKTTTKEIVASILKEKFNIITNKGNLNSETGLPLSVFNIRKEHEIGIFEMGMNRVDEIKEIAGVLKPQYAIITNIGTAHIGLLGSRENIAKEKSNIFNHFGDKSKAIIPVDDDFASYLAEKANGKVSYYGKDTDRVKFAEDLGLEGTKFTVDGTEAILNLPGKYNYKNALGAMALAMEFGLSGKEIASGLEKMEPMFGRSEIIKGKYTIIQDCYNANPDSMEKSIEFASSVKCDGNQKKIFVLGDMLELGKDSFEQHRKIGMACKSSDCDGLIFIGKEMKAAYEECSCLDGKKVMYYDCKIDDAAQEISSEINSFAPEKSIILIKGSRGIGLEKLTDYLMKGDD